MLVRISRDLIADEAWALRIWAILLVGLPNVLYQALNDWPQLRFGRALSAHNSGSVRVSMWPMLLLLLGPPLVVFWISGLVALRRRPQWRAVRFLAPALPVLLVFTFILGSQSYCPLGLVGVLFAVGCVPVHDWIVRARTSRRTVVVVVVAINAVVSAVIALPLIPVRALKDTPIPGITSRSLTRSAGPRTPARSPPSS